MIWSNWFVFSPLFSRRLQIRLIFIFSFGSLGEMGCDFQSEYERPMTEETFSGCPVSFASFAVSIQVANLIKLLGVFLIFLFIFYCLAFLVPF